MVHNLPSKKAGKNPNDKTSMQVSWRLKDFVFLKSNSRESEEETLWRLIGMKEISKEDAKQFPSEYTEKLKDKKRRK